MNGGNLGVLCILSASIMWALEPVFAKLSYSGSDFIHTSAVRAFVISFVALLYAVITKGNLRVDVFKRNDYIYAGNWYADPVLWNLLFINKRKLKVFKEK